MEPIKFYHNPMSRGATVHWMLEEVQAKYEIVLLDFKRKDHKSPQFLAINPLGKIPAIIYKGVVITETPAICTFLADNYSLNKLAPFLDDPFRGAYLRWMFFASTCVEPVLVDKMFKRENPDPSSTGYGTYAETMAIIEKQLQKTAFILGPEFTAVDVYLSSQLSWGVRAKALDATPTISAYLARCQDRPAYKRFSIQSAALVEKIQAMQAAAP